MWLLPTKLVSFEVEKTVKQIPVKPAVDTNTKSMKYNKSLSIGLPGQT